MLVSGPAEAADEGVLCKEVSLHDAKRAKLPLAVQYETAHGCVHTLSLVAPYWVVNMTGMPLCMREVGSKASFRCGS